MRPRTVLFPALWIHKVAGRSFVCTNFYFIIINILLCTYTVLCIYAALYYIIIPALLYYTITVTLLFVICYYDNLILLLYFFFSIYAFNCT